MPVVRPVGTVVKLRNLKPGRCFGRLVERHRDPAAKYVKIFNRGILDVLLIDLLLTNDLPAKPLKKARLRSQSKRKISPALKGCIYRTDICLIGRPAPQLKHDSRGLFGHRVGGMLANITQLLRFNQRIHPAFLLSHPF